MVYNPLTGLDEPLLTEGKPEKKQDYVTAPATPAPVVEPIVPVVPPAPVMAQQTVTSPETITKAPETSTTSYSGQTTVRGKVQTPEEKALLGKQEALDQNALALEKKKTDLQIEIAKEKEKQARNEEIMAANKQQELAVKQMKMDEIIAGKTKEYNDRYNDYKNMKMEDFWDNKSTGTKIIAALAVGLGAFGGALTGQGGNKAFDILKNEMDRDFEKQKANILKAKDTVGLAKEGIDMAYQTKADQLRSLDLKYAAAAETIAKQYASMLAKKGVPAAQIEADINIQKLNQEAQDRKMKVQEGLRKDIQTESARTVTTQTSGGETVKSGGTSTTYKAAEPKDYKNEMELRKEFNALPEVKDFKTVKTAYEKIKSAPSTAAGDMSLIFSYMKMNDPGSTVREGEYATAENTRSVPESVRALYNKVLSGEKLTDAQRKEFKQSSKSLMAAQKIAADKASKEYSTIAKQYGAEPSRVVTVDLTDEPKEEEKKVPAANKPSWAK